ncbi:DNA polymerase eta [Ostrinia nubilalis]|uniref:DNA polymerase eta n=1 Tax=Ostrinia nubilalis TaxID=29057 RepID=UPI0030824963
MAQENRVVVLIDMDCFYCQVEEKLNPELAGKPIAVVQYNPWKGGGIIAVNYVARAMGVTRHMRGDEAKEKCPEIQLPSVPCQRGKADISKYRDAGKDVAKVLQKFTTLLERASIDEAYLDITAPVQERLKTINVNSVTTDLIPNTYALGYDSVDQFIDDIHNCGCDSIDFDYEHAKELLVGAIIVSEIRAAVYEETGYRCSAGIAHNKILAKLVCGMNKPNKQTILPKHSVNMLYSTLSVKKVKHLGGKFGDTVCDLLKIKNMIDLQVFTEKDLQAKFDEKNGTWLYNIARGIDLEPVQARFNPKSIGCCKQLRGKSALVDLDSLKKWLTDLGDEIEDRLEKDALENNRTPKQMVVSFSTSLPDGRDISSSRSYNFIAEDELCGELFTKKALELVLDTTEGLKIKDAEGNRRLKAPIKFLGISVGKFEDNTESKKTKRIVDYFCAGPSKDAAKTKENDKTNDKALTADKKPINKNEAKEYILNKFFQITNKTLNKEPTAHVNKNDDSKEVVVESTLEKQESFFAKFLNKNTTQFTEDPTPSVTESAKKIHPPTPVCDVINCGDNSNDTAYSGSTINEEINKSVALFEEDPADVDRVSNMRQLLNSTMIPDVMETNEVPDNEESHGDDATDMNTDTEPNNLIDTITCSECGKTIEMDKFDTHADYHLALRLRDEERHQVRLERKERFAEKTVSQNPESKTKIPVTDQSNDKVEPTSIASFLVKIDNTTPSERCSECGKRVPIEKISEHSDFHEAQRLSRELNKKPNPILITGSAVKRKRKSASPVKKPKVPCKSIASFFRSSD